MNDVKNHTAGKLISCSPCVYNVYFYVVLENVNEQIYSLSDSDINACTALNIPLLVDYFVHCHSRMLVIFGVATIYHKILVHVRSKFSSCKSG